MAGVSSGSEDVSHGRGNRTEAREDVVDEKGPQVHQGAQLKVRNMYKEVVDNLVDLQRGCIALQVWGKT